MTDEEKGNDLPGVSGFDNSSSGQTEVNGLEITSKLRSYAPGEEKRIMRNVIVISVAFTLQFTAFNSMSNLQSSINLVAGLGNYSNATIYAAMVLSSFFLPTFLISKFTVKWTLVFSVFGYCIYMAAQFVPLYETLIPAAAILGLCAAPLWTAQPTYLTHVGREYARIVNDKPETIIGRFFGIFFLALQTSHVWGNLIASLVLVGEPEEGKDISVCGSTFCPGDALGSIREVSETARYTLGGIFLACALSAAAVMAIFVDPLVRYGEKERQGEASKLTVLGLFMATANQMTLPYQLLLIPVTIWSGLEQGFFASDYTQAYISCSWDVANVGYVLICYGAFDALASICCGPVVKRVGRVPVFTFGAVLNAAVIVTWFYWKPNPESPVMYFVVAGLWGVGDAVWQTQTNAIYGVLFNRNEEPAFSNFRLWQSFGFIIAFVAGNTICVNIKLYMISAILALGMAGYYTVEYLEWTKNKKSK